jgi:ribosomal protein S6--L-glutamate ligase
MILQDLRSFDVLYYRTGLGHIGALFLRKYLATHGLSAVNLGKDTHVSGGRKTFQILRAARSGVRLPRTLIDHTESYDVLVHELGSPFVAKPDRGSQGRGVRLIRTVEAFSALLAEPGVERIYQAFVPHACDFRVHIVGGVAVAAYSRVSAEDEFRTNVSQGGSMYPIVESRRSELYVLAEKLNASFGLDISAVDFLVHEETGELYFSEINSNPGWEMSDCEATGVDMTKIVLEYLESRVM